MSNEIPQLLRKYYPQFAERQLQEEIAETGKILHFKKDEVIMDYGSYIRLVPLIISGSIKVVREGEDTDKELFLYYLRPGDTCSMSFSCCLMDKKSNIRAIAEEDTVVLGIPVRRVDSWISKYQSWKTFVMRSYDERMTEMVRTIDSIAFKKMDERLLEYLDKKAKTLKSDTFEITHQGIADDLNASREAISRLLKQLETNGAVRLGRNKIQLLQSFHK